MKTLPQFTPENLTSLPANHVFVFGSNLAGRHGAGAAKTAREHFGAITGCGLGLQGQSYAIATKDAKLNVLSRSLIQSQVVLFWLTASQMPERTFWLTRVGCGLARFRPKEMGSLFYGALHGLRRDGLIKTPCTNVHLPEDPAFREPFETYDRTRKS